MKPEPKKAPDAKRIICNHCGKILEAWHDEVIKDIKCRKCKVTGAYVDL